jgi:hypothetical protein
MVVRACAAISWAHSSGLPLHFNFTNSVPTRALNTRGFCFANFAKRVFMSTLLISSASMGPSRE